MQAHHPCDENCENDCCHQNDDVEYDDDTEYDDEEDEYDYDDEDDYGYLDKWRYSIYSAIVFLIISSPYAYISVNVLLKKIVKISSANGCPTLVGLLVHAVVFMLIIRGMMELDI
jgi:hypothetical protein